MGNLIKGSSSLENKNVVIGNVITRAAQGLTLAEKRIIFAGIAKLSGINGEVTLSAQEYADTYGISTDTAYKQLKSATDNLLKRYLRWQVKDGKKIGTLTCSWLQGYKYFDQEGQVKFLFSQYIFPYLFELNSEFTKYKLKQACALRSVHSWRMLEMMEQMKDKVDNDGWLKLSIEEFWHAMDAKESYKKTFGLLRKWVIEPAVIELQEKDNWLIEWVAVKTGRRVSSVNFRFKRDPQGLLFSINKNA